MSRTAELDALVAETLHARPNESLVYETGVIPKRGKHNDTKRRYWKRYTNMWPQQLMAVVVVGHIYRIELSAQCCDSATAVMTKHGIQVKSLVASSRMKTKLPLSFSPMVLAHLLVWYVRGTDRASADSGRDYGVVV